MNLTTDLMKQPEFDSRAWLIQKDRAEKRLQDLRAQNDSTSLDAIQTAILRGQIKELKLFLDQEKSNDTRFKPASLSE